MSLQYRPKENQNEPANRYSDRIGCSRPLLKILINHATQSPLNCFSAIYGAFKGHMLIVYIHV